MPRTPVEIDRAKLEEAVMLAEIDGPLKNQNKLWNEAATLYNDAIIGTGLKSISHSLVMLRVNEWGIEIKTPKGVRGKKAMSETHKIKLKAGREKAKLSSNEPNPRLEEYKEGLRAKCPPRYYALVAKSAEGSKAAARKLMCLECVGFKTAYVRECTAVACPLWIHRPYQGAVEPEEDEEREEESAEAQERENEESALEV